MFLYSNKLGLVFPLSTSCLKKLPHLPYILMTRLDAFHIEQTVAVFPVVIVSCMFTDINDVRQ